VKNGKFNCRQAGKINVANQPKQDTSFFDSNQLLRVVINPYFSNFYSLSEFTIRQFSLILYV